MATEREQFCFNCGAPLGVYRHYLGDIEVCVKKECNQEARRQHQIDEEDRRMRAEEDDYQRY